MKTTRLVILILALVSLMIQGCSGESLKEGEVLIVGNIQKHDRYETKEAYIQLVPVQMSEDKIELADMTALRDIHGELVAVECVSDYPKLPVPPDFRFKYSVKTPKPGRYILALQHLIPQDVGRHLWVVRPLGQNSKALIVEIPEGAKTPYRLDIGMTSIAFAESDRFAVTEYKDTVLVKP